MNIIVGQSHFKPEFSQSKSIDIQAFNILRHLACDQVNPNSQDWKHQSDQNNWEVKCRLPESRLVYLRI